MTEALSLPHLKQLDGVRAVAIILVFLSHAGLGHIIPGGLGVTIFFFLSGFLITSLLRVEVSRTQRIDLKAFYIRRTLRIWPSLYLTMAFSIAVILATLPEMEITTSGVIAQALFLENYSSAWAGPGVQTMPLWSLAIEEHFYLILPFLYAHLLMFVSLRRAALWCAIACVAVLAVRLLAASVMPDLGGIYYWTHTRVDSILFGSCLALWHNPALDANAWRPKLWQLGAAICALLLTLVIRDEFFRQTLRYTIQDVALFAIFSWVLWDKGRIYRLLTCKPMRVVGLYSYTLYLSHRLFIEISVKYLPDAPHVEIIIVSGAASMLFAALMYTLVEGPIAARRKASQKMKDVTMAHA